MHVNIDKRLLTLLFAIPVAVAFLVVGIVLIVRACRNRFFRRFLIIPFLFVPALSLYAFFALWRIGLSSEKLITLLICALPLFCSAFTLLVILIIWFFKRHVLWHIVQLYLVIGAFAFAFVHYDYKQMASHLNIYLYQDDREAVIARLRSDTLSEDERRAMIYIDTLRNVPHPVRLHSKETNLDNTRFKDTGDSYVSEMRVKRNCDGELVAEFKYDSDASYNYYFIYSDALPDYSIDSTWTAGLGTARAEEYYKIEKYIVVETIQPHWYYVKESRPGFTLDFSGLFGGSGWGGGASGGSAGGCQ